MSVQKFTFLACNMWDKILPFKSISTSFIFFDIIYLDGIEYLLSNSVISEEKVGSSTKLKGALDAA